MPLSEEQNLMRESCRAFVDDVVIPFIRASWQREWDRRLADHARVAFHAGHMAQATNRLQEVGGGIVVVSGGTELALVELPIAGLMSDERAEIVAAKANHMMEAMRACGCSLNNAYMQHSLLALVVIPELRISDVGLVDVRTFRTTELFVG